MCPKCKGEGVKAFSPAALGFGVRFHWQPRAVEHDNRDDLVVLEHLNPVGAVSNICRHAGARDEASALAQLAAAGVSALVQPGVAINANLQFIRKKRMYVTSRKRWLVRKIGSNERLKRKFAPWKVADDKDYSRKPRLVVTPRVANLQIGRRVVWSGAPVNAAKTKRARGSRYFQADEPPNQLEKDP
jgi:hypothetical protein